MQASFWIDWFRSLITGFSQAYNWLVNPITIGSISIAPIYLVGFAGLSAFITIAIVKWVIS